MHTEHEPRPDPLVDMGYETRDLNLAAIRKATIGFFVFAIASFVVVFIWFRWTSQDLGAKLDSRKPGPQYPNPRLQTNMTTRTDIAELRQHETSVLTTYGSNPDGSVRIPVDRAIDILADRGLPNVGSEVPVERPGNTIPQNALPPGSPSQSVVPTTPLVRE